jgi:peptide/nickel transport system ATP-binding protein
MSNLIEVKNLKRYFATSRGTLHAVDDVNLAFEKGKTMGVVGESGCGKSTLARTIIHLHPPTEGQILYNGEDITWPNRKQLSRLRNEMQIIFQDPYSTLNPRYTIEDTLREPLTLSGQYTKADLNLQVRRLMDMVGISGKLRMAYPHELSGGRRQRVGIGRSLAMNPKFIACDEPVSSLDVSIQAQIINLLQDLQKDFDLTYMFVTHDMGVVRHISHNISVMYLGQLVESSPTEELFSRPMHPYTRALLSAIPTVDIDLQRQRIKLKGELKSPINPQPECRFRPRCIYATEKCRKPQKLEEADPGHLVSCCRMKEIDEINY